MAAMHYMLQDFTNRACRRVVRERVAQHRRFLLRRALIVLAACLIIGTLAWLVFGEKIIFAGERVYTVIGALQQEARYVLAGVVASVCALGGACLWPQQRVALSEGASEHQVSTLLSNPGADLDLSTSTDGEDSSAFIIDIFEFSEQDRLFAADVVAASIGFVCARRFVTLWLNRLCGV